MLTTLLSLIVYNINYSTSDINVTMITFMSSLLLTRLMSLGGFLKARTEIILGSCAFILGCLILVVVHNSMSFMFAGAILFGLSIGLIPPAILVLLSEKDLQRDSNLGIYNIIVALASVFSPLIGEGLYNLNAELLFIGWFVFSIVMGIMSLLIKKSTYNKEASKKSLALNLKSVMFNKQFQISFVVLLFSSISYGSVVSYLPVYFDSLGYSIGIYYFSFWSGYIIVQFVKRVSFNFRVILFALFFILLGQLSLVLIKIQYIIYTFTFIYGVGYGSLFKSFYINIGNFENEYERGVGFSIIGLISYIGVGIAPVFLMPFNHGWEYLFFGNSFYSLIALIAFSLLWKGSEYDK